MSGERESGVEGGKLKGVTERDTMMMAITTMMISIE